MSASTRKPRRLPAIQTPIDVDRARQEAEKRRRLEAKRQARPATSDHAREFRARVANASAKVDDRNSWQPVRAQTAVSEPSPMRRLMDHFRGGSAGTGGQRQLTVEVDASVAPPAESPLLSALRSATRSIRRAWGGGGERNADGAAAEMRSPGRRWLQRGGSGRSSRASRGDDGDAAGRSGEGGANGEAASDGRAILDAWKQEDSHKQRGSFSKFMRDSGGDSGRAEAPAAAVDASRVPQAPERTPPAKATGKSVTGLARFRRFRLTDAPLTDSQVERMKGRASPVRCAGTAGHDAAQVRGGQVGPVVEGDGELGEFNA